MDESGVNPTQNSKVGTTLGYGSIWFDNCDWIPVGRNSRCRFEGLEQQRRQLQLKMVLWNLSWEAIALYRRKDGVELEENVVVTSPYQDNCNKLNRFDFKREK
jgi:hypothetical protein